jgi:phosphoglucomutase
MAIHPLAGQPAPASSLIDVGKLDRAYHENRPDFADPFQLVAFGTSGHRGTPLRGTFTEAHILAITQAICDYRRSRATDGPLYMHMGTCTWARTRTRCPGRPSAPRLRFWRLTG